MKTTRSILLALTTAAAAGATNAADPVRLDKAELEKMLPGKTLNYTNVNGTAAIVRFEPDGRATYRSGNAKGATGTWTVEDNGRYCIKFTSGTTQDHCRSLWKTDAGYATGAGRSSDNLQPVSGLD